MSLLNMLRIAFWKLTAIQLNLVPVDLVLEYTKPKLYFNIFLKKKNPAFTTISPSPFFNYFFNLLRWLAEYLKVGKLQRNFLSQCDLLHTVDDMGHCIAHKFIVDILSVPLNAPSPAP